MKEYYCLYEYEKEKTKDGVWKKEPDLVLWKDSVTGLDCIIKRLQWSLHLCGYVKLSESHIHYGRIDDFDLPYDVHGDVTFADFDKGQFGNISDDFYIGFDCNHSGDYYPSSKDDDASGYKNINFVKNECEKLAKQIINF